MIPSAHRRRCRPLLGTYVDISASGPSARIEDALLSAFAHIQLVHDLLSFHSPESDLTRLNQSVGQWIPLHAISLRVLKLAKLMTLASEGRFNMTTGAQLVRCGVLPDHDFGERLSSGDAGDLEVSSPSARLVRPVLITLDGIAKGYAVDLAVRTLMRCGMTGGIVNAGGDLRVFGTHDEPIHLRDYHATGNVIPAGRLRNAAIATSACSAQYDPATPGMIVSSEGHHPVGVWSVAAARAWRADALTKVAANTEPAQRSAVLKRLGGRYIEPPRDEGIALQ